MSTTLAEPIPVFEDIDKWVADALTPPDSFAMFEDDPNLFHTWSLGPVFKHRDSDSIQRANAISLMKVLEADPALVGWRVTRCHHWAVGHVEHLTFRVLCKMKSRDDKQWAVPSRPGYKLTRIARFVKLWFDDLAEYPIADEDELSRIEYEDAITTIESQASSCLSGTELELIDNLPDTWLNSIFEILSSDGSIDHSSDGAWVNEDKLLAALKTLKLVRPEGGPDA